MRIVHVVTLATPDNDYGGPVRVAAGQVAELERRGHDAVLVAATTPELEHADRYQGAAFRGFHAVWPGQSRGYAGLRARGLRSWLRSSGADIVHVHLARDLVTMPAVLAAQRAGIPTVSQTHGMITPRSDALARIVDTWGTRRALRGSGALLALNENERIQLAHVAPGSRPATIVPNGMRLDAPSARTDGSPADVLFLSRLHPRKRPDAFVRAASLVDTQGRPTVFSVVGPDEGALAAVQDAARRGSADIRIEGALAPEGVAARMARAQVFVLPAVDEPFGMVVLEAMAAGTPVVVTESCGLADDVRRAGAGIVVDGSERSLAAAMERLLRDESLRARMGAAARSLAGDFTVSGVVDTLETIYARVTGESAAHGGGSV